MPVTLSFFFFNDTATTEIYTLSLHDALPISAEGVEVGDEVVLGAAAAVAHGGTVVDLDGQARAVADRKSTRLNSSHPSISYAVFCLKKKKKIITTTTKTENTHQHQSGYTPR